MSFLPILIFFNPHPPTIHAMLLVLFSHSSAATLPLAPSFLIIYGIYYWKKSLCYDCYFNFLPSQKFSFSFFSSGFHPLFSPFLFVRRSRCSTTSTAYLALYYDTSHVKYSREILQKCIGLVLRHGLFQLLVPLQNDIGENYDR